jgi:hypothetical protein
MTPAAPHLHPPAGTGPAAAAAATAATSAAAVQGASSPTPVQHSRPLISTARCLARRQQRQQRVRLCQQYSFEDRYLVWQYTRAAFPAAAGTAAAAVTVGS